MNQEYVGNGKVVLIASPSRVYTDIAARFTRSDKTLEEIIATPYSKDLVRKILDSNHTAATEFDYFIFGVEGYSRVTEIQLVRKRLASYMIRSGRVEKKGTRSLDVVIPEAIENFHIMYKGIGVENIILPNGESLNEEITIDSVGIRIDSNDILNIIEEWYNQGVSLGQKEEDLRYLKPQATEFKAIIAMNAHALLDWFNIRCCLNAQEEIRDMANKMLTLCKKESPDLFKNAGASCKYLGYCPENNLKNAKCKKTFTKNEALDILKQWKEMKLEKEKLI